MRSNPYDKKNSRTLRYIILILIALGALGIYFGMFKHTGSSQVNPNVKIDGTYVTPATTIHAFNLDGTLNKAFTEQDLVGHWTFMFFGFTNCGMVCPTTMAELNKMYKILEQELPAEKMPQVVMISVDPDNDTVKRMRSYVTSFNPHFIGATGDLSRSDQLKKDLHIMAVKMQADGQGKNHYTINHSAEIMVFNPAGRLQAFLSYPHQGEQMAKDFKTILIATPTKG